MKENKRFNIWKFKKYKLAKYKSIGLFKLFNINKKEKNEFLNLKNIYIFYSGNEYNIFFY